jgi:hypothetical protein
MVTINNRIISNWRIVLVHLKTRKKWYIIAGILAFVWHARFALLITGIGITSALYNHGVSRKGWDEISLVFTKGFLASFAPLPNDEEMIEHFQQHKADFEELAKLFNSGKYHKYQIRETTADETVRVRALLDTLDVDNLNYRSELWIENPYAENARERYEKWKEINWKISPVPYGTRDIYFSMRGWRYRSVSNYLQAMVIKEYYYVPQPPRVAAGKLWLPLVHRKSAYSNEAVPSPSTLNRYPQEWLDEGGLNRYPCVYRQIEDQWFISICNAR